MKKIIVPIIIFSFFFTNAQIKFKPGIKAGLNSANITNTDFDAKTDFYIGAFTTIKFVDFYSLQPEIFYSGQGAKSNFSGENDLELKYFTLAIANKFFPFKDMGLHAIVGPSFDFKVSDNFSSNGFEDPEGFDFGLFVGVGYELPFGLSVEARYKQGIVDVFGRNVNDTISFDELLANKVVQIGVTYQFDF